ncbi:hypothetical protein PFAG_04427 [Plasmodium falciparum Santa Lucia]|uniref:CCAAT-binding factor domain-containing protein n=2 Tax=Plasmodium falciparum TaxID=5833 RepID=A0A0L7KFA8_PLAFX|nr:hypothetical protein PFAG_04427 [Plasmodium falciparum Santa Lucia]KOB62023.1 hypothetical protein PFHG_03804 [Plasmodium falciparum HB3]
METKKKHSSGVSSSTASSATNEICLLFKLIQESHNRKYIINKLTELFLLIYKERLKRMLLYCSNVEEGRNDNNINSDINNFDEKLKYFFRKDSIIFDIPRKQKGYNKYDEWLDVCFEKFLNLLFQLLKNDDEIFVKKSLSILFGSLQFELKIFEKLMKTNYDNNNNNNNNNSNNLYSNDNINVYDNNLNKITEDEGGKKYFPIKLYRRIIIELLNMEHISVNTIKHICKSYICFYYDLDYFFLCIYNSLCNENKYVDSKKKKNNDPSNVDTNKKNNNNNNNNDNNVESTKEKEQNGCNFNFPKDNHNINLLIFIILINSIKPYKKVCLNTNENNKKKKKIYLKKFKKHDLFIDDQENVSRKRKKIYNNNNNNNNNNSQVHINKYYKFSEINDSHVNKNEVKKKKNNIFENYYSDDSSSIKHLSSSSDDENKLDEEDFLKDVNLINNMNSDMDFSDDMLLENTKEKITNKIKERKNNFFINIHIDDKLYCNIYSSCWFYFITTHVHIYTMILQLLHSIPVYVFPYTNNPYYLIDFFNISFYKSPNLYISLAALPGIFHILTELNVGNVINENNYSNINITKLENEKKDNLINDVMIKEEHISDEEKKEKLNISPNNSNNENVKEEDCNIEDNKSDQSNNNTISHNDDDDEEEEEEEDEDATKESNIFNDENKLNNNMYTDYYKRLYELITPASFYYDDTHFLKIIHLSIKNKMIPIYYILSFLKKLLRIGCLTSYNISINILSVVYDILNYFKNELYEAMFISSSLFMIMDFKKDSFCYDNLLENFDKDKIMGMLKMNSLFLKDTCRQDEDDPLIKKTKNESSYEFHNNINHIEGSNKGHIIINDDDEKKKKNLFNIQECIPEKYKINMNKLNKKQLYMINHIFYEIILINNHICDNLKFYSNVYYYNFDKDSSYKSHDFYNDPSKMNWLKETSLFSSLKNFLSFKKKRKTETTPTTTQNKIGTLFL